MMLRDKVVVVSGTGPGLGRRVAQGALRDGARVVLAARNRERLQALAQELDPDGERVAICATDITVAAECERLVQVAVERFGGIDALANIAARDDLFGNLESTTEVAWRQALETNVIGTALLVRAAVPQLAAGGGGAVVLTGAQAMWKSPPHPQLAYASSKGALVSAMYHLAKELGPQRIRVNMVVPSWMWGPPVQGYVEGVARERGVDTEQVVAEISAGMALGAIPADADVAEAILFFCSDRARMITGETLRVTAGEYL